MIKYWCAELSSYSSYSRCHRRRFFSSPSLLPFISVPLSLPNTFLPRSSSDHGYAEAREIHWLVPSRTITPQRSPAAGENSHRWHQRKRTKKQIGGFRRWLRFRWKQAVNDNRISAKRDRTGNWWCSSFDAEQGFSCQQQQPWMNCFICSEMKDRTSRSHSHHQWLTGIGNTSVVQLDSLFKHAHRNIVFSNYSGDSDDAVIIRYAIKSVHTRHEYSVNLHWALMSRYPHPLLINSSALIGKHHANDCIPDSSSKFRLPSSVEGLNTNLFFLVKECFCWLSAADHSQSKRLKRKYSSVRHSVLSAGVSHYCQKIAALPCQQCKSKTIRIIDQTWWRADRNVFIEHLAFSLGSIESLIYI